MHSRERIRTHRVFTEEASPFAVGIRFSRASRTCVSSKLESNRVVAASLETGHGLGLGSANSFRRQIEREGAPRASIPSIAGAARDAEFVCSKAVSSSFDPLVLPAMIALPGTVS